MIPARSSEFPIRRRWPLRLALIFIIAGFGLSNAISLYVMQGNQLKNRLIVDKMLTSIQLLSRLERDFNREKDLGRCAYPREGKRGYAGH